MHSTEHAEVQSLLQPEHPVHPPEHSEPQLTLHVTVHPVHDVSQEEQLISLEDAKCEHPEQ